MFLHTLHLGAVRRLAATLLALAMLLVAMGAPGVASQLPEDDSADKPGLRNVEGVIPVPTPAKAGQVDREGGKALWVWSKGRRGFQLADALGSNGGFETLVSYDLDTREEVARTKLNPRAFKGLAAVGLPHIADVAENDGLLVVGYQADGVNDAANSAQRPVFDITQEFFEDNEPPSSVNPGINPTTSQEICLLVFPGCFAGLLVIDAETLAVVKRIPFTPVSVDGGAVGATLRALRYVPAGEGGATSPKVLAVVEEWVTNPAGPSQIEQPRYQGANIVYVAQFDPITGQQEWVVRADGCRGAREPKDAGTVGTASTRPYPAAVFRTDKGPLPGASVMVACHSGSTQTGSVVRIPLDAKGFPKPLPAEPGDPVGLAMRAIAQGQGTTAGPQDVLIQNAAQQLYTGPDKVYEVFPDPASGRILMKVVDGSPNAEVWWVFDSRREQFVGTIGIGVFSPAENQAVLDEATGRLYVVAPEVSAAGTKGGIFVADTRRTPLSQALVFPQLARGTTGGPPAIDHASEDRPTRLFTRTGRELYRIVVDTLPVSTDLPIQDYVGRTLDLDEVEGVTAAAFDGAARGYGARALMVGGVDSLMRTGPVDAIGQYYGAQQSLMNSDASMPLRGPMGLPVSSPCTEASREIVLGSIGPSGPAVVDAAGGRAGAEPIVIDSGLRTDSEKPISRCSPIDWTELWSSVLFARSPIDEPEVGWPFGAGTADCVSSADSTTDTFSDPTTGWFSAAVDCGDESISGWSRARAIDVAALDLTVAEASSNFMVYRDPHRGVVARVESAARGVEIKGVLKVNSVRVVAESWANGRNQPVAAADREEGYKANCDMERSAGTCFVRSVNGVWTPGWSCGPCGDEVTMVDRLNKAMGSNGKIALREPDPRMAAGSENGYIAAIQKPDQERFADLVLNNDLLQTVVPGLEIIRYTAPNRTLNGGGPRGRQVYQFAGAEVSTSYGIQCLLEYDEQSNVCAESVGALGSLKIELADTDGKPLAGGAFEVRNDTDGDGVLGLADTLLPEGACVTTTDGVGTCQFDGIKPGAYLVSQTAAPAGFSKLDEATAIVVNAGEAATLAVVNASNISQITVKAEDENGGPLAGAVFGAYADPDADGKIAEGAKPAATCTTGADGTCTMKVAAGSYVLVQTSAAAGLESMEPVSFTVAGGQTAAVGVVNYSLMPAGPAPAAGPVVDYQPPPSAPAPSVTVDEYTPPVDEAPQVSVPEVLGGTIVRVIKAPGDVLRLLSRSPMQALAWVASVVMFVLAGMVVRRRQQATALMNADG